MNRDTQKQLARSEALVHELQGELDQTNRDLLQLTLELEDRVAARTTELHRSIEELQQFAYIVSHDLQEPLRTISGFVGLLKEDCWDKLSEDEHHYMEHVLDGADRMRALIRDLLKYSRAGSGGRDFEAVDTGATVDTVVEQLHGLLESSGGRIERGELPAVSGDPVLLAQLFQNLLGNALKFRGNEAPLVRIEARRDGSAWEFSVRDNGIGFDAHQQDTIFQVFRRLHGRREYEGTGIGLSICKRIVERHGGTIRAESEPGRGATFIFTLPSQGA